MIFPGDQICPKTYANDDSMNQNSKVAVVEEEEKRGYDPR